MSRLRRFLPWIAVWGILWLTVAFCATTYETHVRDFQNQVTPSSINQDVDTWTIHEGVLANPRWQDTLKWWIGPWVSAEKEIPGQPGQHINFYRPVSSVAFWAEWKLFGDQPSRYGLVNGVVVLLNYGLMLAATLALARRSQFPHPVWLCFVALFVFVSGFSGMIHPAASDAQSYVSGRWKDLPDALALAGVFAAVILWARFPRAWWWLIAWAFGVGAKEVVSLLPWTFLCFELLEDRQRIRTWRTAGLMLLPVAFTIFRTVVLHGQGYRYGSLGLSFMIRRFIDFATQPFGAGLYTLLDANTLTAIAMTGICILCYRLRGKMRFWTLAVWILMSFGALYGSFLAQELSLSFVAALMTWFDQVLRFWEMVFGWPVALFAAAFSLKRHRTLAVMGISWIGLTSFTNAFAPPSPHRHYVTLAGYAWFFAPGIYEIGRELLQHVQNRYAETGSTPLAS